MKLEFVMFFIKNKTVILRLFYLQFIKSKSGREGFGITSLQEVLNIVLDLD